ncbi:LLM class flavin-dependent oxidoreductase [Georgenia halophila]|uniref:LLM class flavin-dependent oxidoreductase n=1 Tax=Georgenia halophila TaxID=620889 RepID=A0ABP8L415_9MICO
MTPTTGVIFRPQSSPEDLRSTVEAADQAGVAELWLWEDCFFEGGLTTATAALSWSDRLRVGIGILPVPLRNPALTAMEIATLSRLFPGRFVPGLGHGVLPWMRQVGAGVDSPMTLLREHVSVVRDLLAGRTVDVQGRYVHLDDVTLDWPPQQPPELILGARGPRTVALAGEVADGAVLDVADLDKVREVRSWLDEARAAAGRDGRSRLVVNAAVEVQQDHSGLSSRVADEVGALRDAGADTVALFSADDDAPDPRPLIEALADLR